MRYIQFVFLLLVALYAFCGCSASARYVVELEQVLEPEGATSLHGPVVIGHSKMSGENDLFSADWEFEWTSVNLEFENLSDSTIYIDWNECVFVDPQRGVHHIVPDDMRYLNVYDSIKPAKVPSGCKVFSRMIPRDNVRWSAAGWSEVPYLPRESMEGKETFRKRVMSFVGDPLEVVLAIEVDGEYSEYRYVFKIIEAGLTKERMSSQAGSEF